MFHCVATPITTRKNPARAAKLTPLGQKQATGHTNENVPVHGFLLILAIEARHC